MALTLPELSLAVSRLYDKLQQRRPDAAKWMKYYRGEQGALLFASEDFVKSCGDRFDGFSDNWCAPVAEAAAERTVLQGIKLPDSPIGKQSEAESMLWGALMDNDLEAQLAQAFLQARIQRRTFASVWAHPQGSPLAGKPLVTMESAEQVYIEYDPEIRWRRSFGLKAWMDDHYEWVTFDDADYIYRLRRPRGSLGGIRPSGLVVPALRGGNWELVGEPIKNHLGLVTFVELPNLPPLTGEPLSAISGVAAVQDAINLLWAYLFNAADYVSLPGRVVMGAGAPLAPILGEDGQIIGERPVEIDELTKGRILWLGAQGAQIGEWSGASVDQFLKVIEQMVAHVASQTRTPAYYLATNQSIANISDAAMKTLDTGLNMTVKKSHRHLTGRIRDIAVLVGKQLGIKDDILQRATPSWQDPAIYSEAAKADAFQKNLASGYPFEWLLLQDGRSPQEIDMIMQMKRAEADDPLFADLVSKLGQAGTQEPIVSDELTGAGDGTS